MIYALTHANSWMVGNPEAGREYGTRLLGWRA